MPGVCFGAGPGFESPASLHSVNKRDLFVYQSIPANAGPFLSSDLPKRQYPMITKEQAYGKALAEVQRTNVLPVVIVDVSENASCWMFHYNSVAYLETREIRYRLAGNAPVIIDKADGSLHTGGTRFASEFYLRAYHRCKQENRDYDEYLKTT